MTNKNNLSAVNRFAHLQSMGPCLYYILDSYQMKSNVTVSSCNTMIAFKTPDFPHQLTQHALPLCNNVSGNSDDSAQLAEGEFVITEIASYCQFECLVVHQSRCYQTCMVINIRTSASWSASRDWGHIQYPYSVWCIFSYEVLYIMGKELWFRMRVLPYIRGSKNTLQANFSTHESGILKL